MLGDIYYGLNGIVWAQPAADILSTFIAALMFLLLYRAQKACGTGGAASVWPTHPTHHQTHPAKIHRLKYRRAALCAADTRQRRVGKRSTGSCLRKDRGKSAAPA